MREIKFRAWDANKEEYFIKQMSLDQITRLLNGDKIPGLKWQQYTGLKDKNGKEIYEGDIVILHSVDSLKSNQRRVVDVRFDDYSFAFWDKSLRFATVDYDHRADQQNPREVIGNIYENPELLK